MNNVYHINSKLTLVVFLIIFIKSFQLYNIVSVCGTVLHPFWLRLSVLKYTKTMIMTITSILLMKERQTAQPTHMLIFWKFLPVVFWSSIPPALLAIMPAIQVFPVPQRCVVYHTWGAIISSTRSSSSRSSSRGGSGGSG